MNDPALVYPSSGVINLDQPGTYLHWSIFTVSVANLVLIAVMVVIFGAALVLPFPTGRTYPAQADLPAGTDPGTLAGSPGPGGAGLGVDEDAGMWTSRLRRRALSLLPPGKLLPDRQPAYVASWVYVFGVASLAALGVAIVSGFAIAVGGTDWWHTNPVGHFFNSLHLWSVELFMAFLVIHLWGKFWMAAWRGRRAMTWITGVVAFVASVVECFTGYLSQQNFDSQWISASGKDAFNPVGLGAFFNILNFGQMLLWHVVLVPIVLVAIVGAHILLVRVRGVSHPLPAHLGGPGSARERRKARKAADAAPWRGPTRRYDIIKEGAIATLVVLVLSVALSWLLASPDVPSATIQSWAKTAPADFLATAATELNGTSGSATYGPPYNNATGSTQSLLFAPAKITGVTQPINAAHDFVLGPLGTLAPTDPRLATALATYNAAPPAQRMAWANAYLKAVAHVKFAAGDTRRPGRRRRPGAGHARQRAHHGPQRRAGCRPAGEPVVLRHQLHQAAAVHGRWHLLRGQGHRHEPVRRPVGCHERDRQLPRPALAVAVHAVVLRPRLLRLRQRGHDRGLPDRPGHHLAAGHTLHPRPARHPPLDPGPPPDLARIGTRPRQPGRRRRPGRSHPPRQHGHPQLMPPSRPASRLRAARQPRSESWLPCFDAVRLARATERQMISPSSVPPPAIRRLLDLTDICSMSGRDMMAALVAGERNPKVLAQLARRSTRKKSLAGGGVHRVLHRPSRFPAGQDAGPRRCDQRRHRRGEEDLHRVDVWAPAPIQLSGRVGALSPRPGH